MRTEALSDTAFAALMRLERGEKPKPVPVDPGHSYSEDLVARAGDEMLANKPVHFMVEKPAHVEGYRKLIWNYLEGRRPVGIVTEWNAGEQILSWDPLADGMVTFWHDGEEGGWQGESTTELVLRDERSQRGRARAVRARGELINRAVNDMALGKEVRVMVRHPMDAVKYAEEMRKRLARTRATVHMSFWSSASRAVTWQGGKGLIRFWADTDVYQNDGFPGLILYDARSTRAKGSSGSA